MRHRWIAAALAALTLGACEALPTDPEDPNEPLGEVGETGGALATKDGGVKLDFPEGALGSNTPITVQPVSDPPQDSGLVPGTVYDFGPDGTTFATPVTLTIRYDRGKLPQGTAESSLALYKQIGSGWQRVAGSSANPQLGVVTGSISSFSTYAILSTGAPRTLAVHAGATQSAVVGQDVTNPPAVLVRNERGEVLPGVAVTFAVAAGGGKVTGATATTNDEGIATVGGWTLGTKAGENRLTATVAGLADSPVNFSATGTPDAPTGLALHAGRGQQAAAGRSVAIPPAVKVTDGHGNPVEGAAVVFAIGSGAGSITGANALTDTAGIAAVGSWTLGTVPGINTLSATLGGVTPLVVSATAVDPCAWTEAYTIGATVSGDLDDLDCADGIERRIDRYRFTTDKQVSLALTLTTTGFTPFIRVEDTAGNTLVTQFTTSQGFTRALLAPGDYVIAVQSADYKGIGNYQMNAVTVDHDVDECGGAANVFATPGTSTKGSLTAGNCTDQGGGDPTWRWDRYVVRMEEGKTYTVTMSASGPATLARWGTTGLLDDLQGSDSGRTPLVITYTAAETDYQSFYALGPVGTTYDINFAAGTASVDPCEVVHPYTVGTTVRGWLSADNCVDTSGRKVDSYQLTTDKQLSLLLTMGSGYTPFIGVRDAAGYFVVTQYGSSPGYTRATLAPGTYTITTRSVEPGAEGFYEMRAEVTDHDLDECGVRSEVFVTVGTRSKGRLTAGNCGDPFGDPTSRVDWLNIWLLEGQTYTFTMTMDRGALLSLWQGANHITVRDRADAGTVTITHTATVSGWHTLNPIGPAGTEYEVTVTGGQGASAAPALSPRRDTVRPKGVEQHLEPRSPAAAPATAPRPRLAPAAQHRGGGRGDLQGKLQPLS